MVTFWKQPKLLSVGELTETDRAFNPVLEINPPKLGDWKRAENVAAKAASGNWGIGSGDDEMGPAVGGDSCDPIISRIDIKEDGEHHH